MLRTTGAVVLAAVLATGCAQLEGTSKETIGTGTGAVVGGVVGRSVTDDNVGTVLGGVVGAIAGGAIGRRMDATDREHAFAAFEENRTESWTNPDTGANYTLRPTGTTERDGRICREYTTDIQVEGDVRQASGTACQRGDGTWEIVQ